MSKRLTRSDYVFSLVFIFLIICTIAAFFYGLKVGKEKTEQKFLHMLSAQEEIDTELTAYHQQYLVSFYHTTFLPYRDFQKTWFSHMDALELRSNTTDVESVFKELDKLAREHYNQLLYHTIPDTSPLLQQAQGEYLKSLKLFSEAINKASFGKLVGLELINMIEEDAFFQEAMSLGLSAQYKYYASVLKWHQSIDTDVRDLGELAVAAMRVHDWEQLLLNEKNTTIAFMMDEKSYYEPYFVHDVTLRIDELILTGQAEKMNLHHVNEIMDVLVNTRAVRSGDFISNKERYYQEEVVPQLPFYYE